MSLSVCIDWGNSRVKAAIFNANGEMAEAASFAPGEASDALSGLLSTHNPVKGILCSVSNDSAAVESMLNANLKAFMVLNNNTPLPIMNAYSSPGTLGADRLALAVGAHTGNPAGNNLVVSLGTCITYNFIQKNRTFRGGAISPGLHMRLQAMHSYTDKLPVVNPDGELLLLGYDTETCMRSGAIFGMAAEIDGMVAEFAARYADFNAILTGGDAAFFGGKLKSKIFADPDLLLKGLNVILKHNVPFVR